MPKVFVLDIKSSVNNWMLVVQCDKVWNQAVYEDSNVIKA